MNKFMSAQKEYVDHNGNKMSVEKVENISTYKHIMDGFYTWVCSNCRNKHDTRSSGWPISGQILKCEECKKLNLLLRSDTDEVNKAIEWYFSSLRDSYEDITKRIKETEDENRNLKNTVRGKINMLLDPIKNEVIKQLSRGAEK